MLKAGDITHAVYFKNICNGYEFEPNKKIDPDALSETSDDGSDTDDD